MFVHTAAQPSHDWPARDPHTDITVNANGTQNTTPDGIDDRSCWTEARQGTYPK